MTEQLMAYLAPLFILASYAVAVRIGMRVQEGGMTPIGLAVRIVAMALLMAIGMNLYQ